MRDLTETERNELAERLQTLLNAEPETSEEIDAYLRVDGFDPEAIAARGRAIAAKALEKAKKTPE